MHFFAQKKLQNSQCKKKNKQNIISWDFYSVCIKNVMKR